MLIMDIIRRIRYKRAVWWDRHIKVRALRNTEFCLISNNCWGSMHYYQRFGIKYNIPTVGLYISDHDFIRFCNNLEYYLGQPIKFITPEESPAYEEVRRWGIKLHNNKDITFPVGMIADVTLWFMHYKSKEEAIYKWYKRRVRVNLNNIIIKWSQRYTDDVQTVMDFIDLPYRKFGIVDESCPVDSPCLIKVRGWNNLKDNGGDEIGFLGTKLNTINVINNAIN